jgi:hypothetical protein
LRTSYFSLKQNGPIWNRVAPNPRGSPGHPPVYRRGHRPSNESADPSGRKSGEQKQQ